MCSRESHAPMSKEYDANRPIQVLVRTENKPSFEMRTTCIGVMWLGEFRSFFASTVLCIALRVTLYILVFREKIPEDPY